MTFTLTALRDDVEADLRDTVNAVWTTAQLDRAIAQALARYTPVAPRVKTVSLTVTGRTADLSAAAPGGLGATDYAALIRVVAAEYPVGGWPPTYLRFDVVGATLTLHADTALAAATVAVTVHLTHTLDGSGGTIPDRDRETMALGAAAFALNQLAAGRVDTLNTNPQVLRDARALADDRHALFNIALGRLAGGVRLRQAFRPDEPFTARDVVNFPD